ncbi:MAG: hypothetical protein E7302_00805 [Butyrivibrio sp.]|nr:hypothetical protein [Butyrivibrio sp.]
MGDYLFDRYKEYLMDRNQALQIVAHVAGRRDYDKANEMLSIIERSIKEDKKNKNATNLVRFSNDDEYFLFMDEID